MEAPPIAIALGDAMRAGVPQRVSVAEDAINKYLQYTVKSKASTVGISGVEFQRPFVACDNGRIAISMEQKLLGYSLYATTFYQLAIEGNALVAKNVGGAIGRLPLHPQIMAYADKVAFKKLWEALDREHKLVADMRAIEVRKNSIVFTTKGGAR